MEKGKRYRNEVIFVRCTAAEKEAVRERMKMSGYTGLSCFLLDMGLKGYLISVNTKELKDVSYEIHKIGVNVNQVAHRVNETHQVYQTDMDELKLQMDALWSLMQTSFAEIQ